MRRIIGMGVVVLVCSFSAGPAAAQPARAGATDPWYGRATRGTFQVVKPVDGSFQIEWAKRDWMLLPSTGAFPLALASRKGDAMVVVERAALRQPLEPSDITDLFAQLESDGVKEREKQSLVDLQARVIDDGARRLVVVQYQRTGILGPERVRLYSFPVGAALYRVTCVSAADKFLSYDSLFAHMATTFKVSQ